MFFLELIFKYLETWKIHKPTSNSFIVQNKQNKSNNGSEFDPFVLKVSNISTVMAK